MKTKFKKLSPEEQKKFLALVKIRFEKNSQRHPGIPWTKVEARLKSQADKISSLYEMENTGGEPDVVGQDKKSGAYLYYDCSMESPSGRRSLCYDRPALESRKEHKPKDNAIDVAAAMGIKILNEEQYRQLQQLGTFDTKTSSWIETPPAIRKLGGAVYCDRRYNQVFLYHNGAESYYASRGFRGCLEV